MRGTILLASVLALGGCAASNAESTSLSPSPSVSETINEVAVYEELATAVTNSLAELERFGTSSVYSDDGSAFFLEIYDPNSNYDYRGVGWVMESDTVELLLDLNMFSLYQLQSALDTAQPIEVQKIDTNKFVFNPTAEQYSEEVTVTIGPEGFVTAIDFPAAEKPDSILVTYGMDEFADSVIKRANEELL